MLMPGQESVDTSRYQEFMNQWSSGSVPTSRDYIDWLNSNPSSNDVDGSIPAQSVEPQPTLSTYMNEHPDASPDDMLRYMSEHSEEWAEKYLDYLLEQGSLDKANEYTASREDSAYQRLVADLRKAGLNPAMMYGSSASISASGSQGYVKQSEGANSRAVKNYSNIQKIFLAYMFYELQKALGTTNAVFKGIGSILNPLSSLF